MFNESSSIAPSVERFGNVEVLFYLAKSLISKDTSREHLTNIANAYPINERMIALPDLHFKVKNFVPSGMTIPIRGGFTPLLLGPNNDGIGSVKIRLSKPLSASDIDTIFESLKARVVMFRRDEDLVSTDTLANILQGNVEGWIEQTGFDPSVLNRFEDQGVHKTFSNLNDVLSLFPERRPERLPAFVPGHNPMERGPRTLGVLDGTSHFIELFSLKECVDQVSCTQLDMKSNDLMFMVHAGSGDIGLITHRSYLLPFGELYSEGTQDFQNAYDAFAVTANYGFANRLFLYAMIRDALQESLGSKLLEFQIISDLPHDYLQKQDGIYLHRKGATRLLSKNYFPNDDALKHTGLPYLFPSRMGGDAYLINHPEGQSNSFETVSHGAGRLLSKTDAVEQFTAESAMEAVGHATKIFRYGQDEIGGQHPSAFKDMNTVMEILQEYDLARTIARFESVAALKA